MSADAELLHRGQPRLPSLNELGSDLRRIHTSQRAAELAWPVALVVVYVACAVRGWWIPALTAVVFFFPRFGVAFHDLLHQSLGLTSRANRVWLAVIGMLALQSGHAIRSAHLAHHRHYPSIDDPEAYIGRLPLWRALAEGPIYQYRMWGWTIRHNQSARAIVIAEAMVHCAVMLGAIAVAATTVVPLAFVGLITVGNSIFPALSENLLHNQRGSTAWERTRTLRGRLFEWYFLELGYHLEHHAYPKVPTRNCGELAARLRPWLEQHGTRPMQLV